MLFYPSQTLDRQDPPSPDEGAGAPGGRFEARFKPDLRAIGEVRRALGDWVWRYGGANSGAVNSDALDDLLIVCSELCTNAVASASRAAGAVAVRARADGPDIVLEVQDEGAGFQWPPQHRLQDVRDEDEHGRGLFIVDILTDAMDVHVAGGRTTVRCTKKQLLGNRAPAADEEMSRRFRAGSTERRRGKARPGL